MPIVFRIEDWIRQMTIPFRNERTVGVKGVYRTRQTEFAARFAQAEFEDRTTF